MTPEEAKNRNEKFSKLIKERKEQFERGEIPMTNFEVDELARRLSNHSQAVADAAKESAESFEEAVLDQFKLAAEMRDLLVVVFPQEFR